MAVNLERQGKIWKAMDSLRWTGLYDEKKSKSKMHLKKGLFWHVSGGSALVDRFGFKWQFKRRCRIWNDCYVCDGSIMCRGSVVASRTRNIAQIDRRIDCRQFWQQMRHCQSRNCGWKRKKNASHLYRKMGKCTLCRLEDFSSWETCFLFQSPDTREFMVIYNFLN